MERLFCLGLSLVLLLSFTASGRSDDNEKATAIIDRAIKAIGGAEKIGKLKCRTWKDKGIYYGKGDGIPYESEYAAQLPGKFRLEMKGHFTVVRNGQKGWGKTGDTTTELSKELFAEYDNAIYVYWVVSLAPLKDKAFKLELVGDDVVDKNPSVAIKVSHEGRRNVTLLFDKKSGQLVQCRRKAKSEEEGGKEVQHEATVTVASYKEFNGIKTPTKMIVKQDGKLLAESETTEVKYAESLDDSLFEKP